MKEFKCKNKKCGFGFYIYDDRSVAECPCCGTKTNISLSLWTVCRFLKKFKKFRNIKKRHLKEFK